MGAFIDAISGAGEATGLDGFNGDYGSGQQPASDPSAPWKRLAPSPVAAKPSGDMGFLGSLLGQDHGIGGLMNPNHQTPPPPPAGWAAQPGKAPVWMEPQRTIDRSATNDTDKNWKMTPENSGSPFKGNRI